MDEVQIPINHKCNIPLSALFERSYIFMKCCSLNSTADQTQAKQLHTAIITAVCCAKTSTNSTKLVWTEIICVCLPFMRHTKLQDTQANKTIMLGFSPITMTIIQDATVNG